MVTDKVELTLPAKRLCTLEGQVIHAVTDIKDGDKYVALEGARLVHGQRNNKLQCIVF